MIISLIFAYLGPSVRLEIQKVTEVMRENVQKVMERGERLEDLQEASNRLTMAGDEFRAAAKKAQQRAWLQNFKTRIILVTITVTIVICIIGMMHVIAKECMIKACFYIAFEIEMLDHLFCKL